MTGNRLLLVPTELERRSLPAKKLEHWLACGFRVELCGFGQIVAAARTMQLLMSERFESVFLVGIAGSLSEKAIVGNAYLFDRVICDGVGVGNGSAFCTAAELGWHQWPVEPTIQDSICLQSSGLTTGSGPLVSVLAASASPEEAAWRRSRFPEGIAEDMEGFGVAVACRLANVPLTIVRGISNRAGDRDHALWNINGSLDLAMQWIFKENGLSPGVCK